MILVDTSVWIDHLRYGNKHLQMLLLDGRVVCHPFIIGEIACGHLVQREKIQSLLLALPKIKAVQENEILSFIERKKLFQFGVGIVDVHLLASSLLSHVALWSLDKRLNKACDHSGVLCYQHP